MGGAAGRPPRAAPTRHRVAIHGGHGTRNARCETPKPHGVQDAGRKLADCIGRLHIAHFSWHNPSSAACKEPAVCIERYNPPVLSPEIHTIRHFSPLIPWAYNLAGLSPLHPRGTRPHKHGRDGAAGRRGDIFAQRGVTFSRNDDAAWLTGPSIRGGLFILVTSLRWVLRVAAESLGLLTSAFSKHGTLLYFEGVL